ncbi:hypothetical protein LY76DRAFT_598523 [Colletotrichum caudatum]|nr:hypothetical protein LY76DRAFT_598523 [Colletotrichum caudatum]
MGNDSFALVIISNCSYCTHGFILDKRLSAIIAPLPPKYPVNPAVRRPLLPRINLFRVRSSLTSKQLADIT